MNGNAALADDYIVHAGQGFAAEEEERLVPIRLEPGAGASLQAINDVFASLSGVADATFELVHDEDTTGPSATADDLVDWRQWFIPSPTADIAWGPLFARVASLLQLTDDWNSYNAPAPNQAAAASARQVLETAREMILVPDEIVPSVEGGITICFDTSGRRADIESFNDGSVLALTSDPPREPYVWPVRTDSENIQEALEEIRSFVGR